MADSLAGILERCLIESAWIRPGTRIIDTPEMYKIENPSMPFPYTNRIYRTCLPEAECGARIRFHLEEYFRQNIAFRWYVFGHSSPAALGKGLEQAGPSSVMEMQGMVLDLSGFSIEMPPGMTVEELSEENLEDYVQTDREGWGRSGVNGAQIQEALRHDFRAGPLSYRAFLARYHGEPAATGALRFIHGIGYLFGASCRPVFRRRGLYRGLVAHRLMLLEKQGMERALVLARNTTATPIFRKLGFQSACACLAYDFAPTGR